MQVYPFVRLGFIFLALGVRVASADAPVVSNVRAAQRPGTGILDVTYDLAGDSSAKLLVGLSISTNGGDAWFSVAASNVTGEGGSALVAPGAGRRLSWLGSRMLPQAVYTALSAKVTAGVPGEVAWFKMDDCATSKRIVDSSVAAFDATNITHNTVDRSVPGVIGTALSFQTTEAAVSQCPAALSAFDGDRWTVAYWGKRSTTYVHSEWFWVKDSVCDGMGWYYNKDVGCMSWLWYYQAGVPRNFTFSFPSATWRHFAFVRSGEVLRLYVNGALVGTNAPAGSPARSAAIYFGGAAARSNYANTRSVDDFRVYRQALDDVQVAGLYNGGLGCDSPMFESGTASDVSPATTLDLSPLCEAVGGSVTPFGNTNCVQVSGENSGDGGASVRLGGAGTMGDGEFAGFEYAVTGTGVLAFDWRVSSEAGYDWLRFYEVGAGETNAISGTLAGWSRVFRDVSGEDGARHVFRWEYEKDPAGDYVGYDCGWVDALSWSPYYTLTVEGGSGDGAYTNGTPISIAADPAPAGMRFELWTGSGASFADARSATTTVTMPAAHAVIAPVYVNVYALEVSGGSGGGWYTNGQSVVITAGAPTSGQGFDRWIGDTQYVGNVAAASTVVRMPATSVSVAATFTDVYPLTVVDGSGDGLYPVGQRVAIQASIDLLHPVFDRWIGDTGTVEDCLSPSTVVVMPASPVTISATFKGGMPEGRFLHFNDYTQTNNAPTPTWVHEGPLLVTPVQFYRALLAGTNHYHRAGWRLLSCRTGCSAYISGSTNIPPVVPAIAPVYPQVASNLAANLRYQSGAVVESPVFTNGVGTLYFETAVNTLDYGQLTVELATNMLDLAQGALIPTVTPPSTDGLAYAWVPIDVLNLTNAWIRYSRALTIRGGVKLRMRRTNEISPVIAPDSAFIVVDNIRVSLPPSDVVVERDAVPFEPGYPAAGAPLKVRCRVSNVDASAPTTSRAVKACTRWRYLDQQVGAWRTNEMSLVAGTGDGAGNGEVYEAALPPAQAGDLEYFFLCAFDGASYVSPDYTGTGANGYPYPPELISPRVLRGAGAEFAVRVRPFASEFAAVCVESDQHAAPIQMALIGDGVWRALVPMGSLGLSNLTWRFCASGEWTAGAAAAATGVTYWAQAGVASARRAPFAAACSPDSGAGRLSAWFDACAYAMVTLDTRSLGYEVRRAEAQDFNAWPARPDVFTSSNGQFAKTFRSTGFGAFPTSTQAVSVEPVAAVISATNVYAAGPFATPAGWVAGGAALVSERTLADMTPNAPQGAFKFRNQAIRLKGGDDALSLGYVRNASGSLTDGVKDVLFRCRAGQVYTNTDICYYREGFTNRNYLVRATLKSVSDATLSPETPSVSLIGYYSDPDNFYEFRVTQVRDPRDVLGATQDRRANLRLYKWLGGSSTLLASTNIYCYASPLVSIADSAPLEMRLFTDANGRTRIRCKYTTFDNVVTALDSVSALQRGSFGFVSSECYASCSSVRTQPTTTDAASTGVESAVLRSDVNFDSDVQAWYLPFGKYVALNSVTPKGIYSVQPTCLLGVYVQDADFASGAEPGESWRLAQQVTVSGFSYQGVTVPLSSWRSQFVKLQMMGRGEVAVDEVATTSWRARDAGFGNVNPAEWLATEAWVVSNSLSQGTVVQLDHSRGDPAAAQGVRSPLLVSGLGSMDFDCRVLRAPALLAVQAELAEAPGVWSDLRVLTCSTNMSGWLHASTSAGITSPGRLRVVSVRGGAATNALVEIDNVQVWDEPPLDARAWRAYNAKITGEDLARVSLDLTKACFLNNSQTANADPVQDLAAPNVQSPYLPDGLGLLAFDARAYDAGQAAAVIVQATTNGWNAAESQWFEVMRFAGITNGAYASFSAAWPEGLDVDAVRLATATTGGARRVCLENIVLAEPLNAPADLVSVRAWPQGQVITRSGSLVEATLRLAGRFELRQAGPGALASAYPRLGVRVNGAPAWATLHHVSETRTPEGWRTDAVFRYGVLPGDMAEPLRLLGTARARDPYVFDWRGWSVVNRSTGSNAVWRFNAALASASDALDPDLSASGVVLRTLAFDDAAAGWVASGRTVPWRVLTDHDVGPEPFEIQVWTPDTNRVQLGSSPGQTSLRLSVVSGGAGATASEAAFTVTGLSEGEAEIVVQRAGDYDANPSAGVAAAIRRRITVSRAPLASWSQVAGRLTGGGVYDVGTCPADAGGAAVVCDGGGGAEAYRFIGDPAVTFTNLTLVVSNGATVVVENLAIDDSGREGASAVLAADGHPQNRLELCGRSSALGGPLAAGVRVASVLGATNRLTIAALGGEGGSLTACGGDLAAGVGGGAFEAGGVVSVSGGAVLTARGGPYGAGVGGGVLSAGGALAVGGGAAVLATGGGSGADDVGAGAYCETPARVELADGLILSGSGVGGVSSFVTGSVTSLPLGPLAPPACWHALSRDGGEPLGWLYVAWQTAGLHMVSNASPAGAYELEPQSGGAPFVFELAGGEAAVPAGARCEAAFYGPWLERHGLAGADLSALSAEAFDAAWLLDQDPVGFLSGELVVSGSAVTADALRVSYDVQALRAGGAQRVTRLNGRLVVLGAWSLDEPFREIADVTESLTSGSYAFELPLACNVRFVRLAVLFPE